MSNKEIIALLGGVVLGATAVALYKNEKVNSSVKGFSQDAVVKSKELVEKGKVAVVKSKELVEKGKNAVNNIKLKVKDVKDVEEDLEVNE